jgi:hypothetical protein
LINGFVGVGVFCQIASVIIEDEPNFEVDGYDTHTFRTVFSAFYLIAHARFAREELNHILANPAEGHLIKRPLKRVKESLFLVMLAAN